MSTKSIKYMKVHANDIYIPGSGTGSLPSALQSPSKDSRLHIVMRIAEEDEGIEVIVNGASMILPWPAIAGFQYSTVEKPAKKVVIGRE